MLGSGGLSIGQAGEFDYSGSQAIKALKVTTSGNVDITFLDLQLNILSESGAGEVGER